MCTSGGVALHVGGIMTVNNLNGINENERTMNGILLSLRTEVE